MSSLIWDTILFIVCLCKAFFMFKSKYMTSLTWLTATVCASCVVFFYISLSTTILMMTKMMMMMVMWGCLVKMLIVVVDAAAATK